MEPAEFQAFAERIIESHAVEPAEIRTAISRAYYAAYHAAFNFLEAIGLSPRTDKWAHDDIFSHFANSGCEDLQRLGSTLGNLHNRRIEADYALSNLEIEKPEIAARVVARTARVLRELGQLPQHQDAAAFTAEMKAWAELRIQQANLERCPICGRKGRRRQPPS